MSRQTENREKPNTFAVSGHLRSQVGFHCVFGHIGWQVRFEGIDTRTYTFSIPFNPTYGTPFLNYTRFGWNAGRIWASTPQNRTYRAWVDGIRLRQYKLLEMVLDTKGMETHRKPSPWRLLPFYFKITILRSDDSASVSSW